MEDKLHKLFSENEFDFHEPHSGHLDRFERKLKNPGKVNKTSWKWLSVAASVVLLIGFWMGSSQQNEPVDMGDFSPQMAETQNYFVASINQELKELEKYRSLDTEVIIEDALEELEELEYSYKAFVEDLNKNGYEKRIIQQMISNYQQRLDVLENVLEQIEELKNTNNTQNNEAYI
mgnify:CR=1 FL=1